MISNGELFKVLKMMVGSNLTDVQLQQIVDKSILKADSDSDGKVSFEDFVKVFFFPLILFVVCYLLFGFGYIFCVISNSAFVLLYYPILLVS